MAIVVVALASSARCLAAPPTIDAIHEVESSVAARSQIDGVGLYEKLEIEVALTAEFKNPFDPDEIDLSADFTAPSGKTLRVNGFFDATASQWLIRFAPTEPGQWHYAVSVRDRAGTTASDARPFRCVQTAHHGFVGIAPNKRYFQYTDGASFYGVGLWYNDSFTRPGRGKIAERDLDRLRELGVNFISFYPSLLETNETGVGRYDVARSARLDQLVQWCDARDMHISWNLVFHANISAAVWGQGNAEYRRNPYRNIAPAREYFASDDVWRHQKNLNRYILARWGYSRAVFLWFVVDEINGTEGWTEGDHAVAEDWCRRMNDDIHAHDPYGRPTTGTQSGGIDQWWPAGYKIFDVAGRELYESQGHPMPTGGKPDLVNDHPLRASYLNYAKQTQDLWNGFEKPGIIGESGYDLTYYEPGTPGYLAAYHNALWATLASGGAATPFWWAYSPYITDGILTPHVRAFAEFVGGIDFAGNDWRPQPAEISAGDAWAMRAGRQMFGWAANPTSGISRETVTLNGVPDGDYDVDVYRTWRGNFLPPIAATAAEGRLTFTFPELAAEDGSSRNLGDDAAFKITPRGDRP